MLWCTLVDGKIGGGTGAGIWSRNFMACDEFLDYIVSLYVVFGGQKQDTVGDRFRYCICRSLPPVQTI